MDEYFRNLEKFIPVFAVSSHIWRLICGMYQDGPQQLLLPQFITWQNAITRVAHLLSELVS